MSDHRRHWREYRTASRRSPVREFLRSQTDEDYAKIAAAMRQVAERGLRAARHLRGDIWEVRVDGTNQAFRILFAPEGRYGQVFLALEAISKKTQRTPPGAIDVAEQRLADWRARGRPRRGP